MRSDLKRAVTIIIGNALIFIPLLMFNGDLFLLVFSYFIEILIGIFATLLIIYGGYKRIGDAAASIGYMAVFVVYILYNTHYLLPDISKRVFPDDLYNNWIFWIVIFMVLGSQIVGFVREFCTNSHQRLPAPECYCFLLFGKSACLFIAAKALLPMAQHSENSLLLLCVFGVTKTIFELILVLPFLKEWSSHDTQYAFLNTRKKSTPFQHPSRDSI